MSSRQFYNYQQNNSFLQVKKVKYFYTKRALFIFFGLHKTNPISANG
jgi:hypothetical protein